MNDSLRQLCLRLARHRKSRLLRVLAAGCQGFVQCCENYNYNPKTNGEYHLVRVVASCSKSMGCVFDVGANVGAWTRTVHAISPEAVVHAFEIAPKTFEALQQATAGLPGVVANDFGLSDTAGPATVKFFYDDPELASLIDVPYDRAFVSVPSSTQTGDAYCRQHGIEHIELLKIDTEGSELLVLKGLTDMLRRGGIDVIQFEYSRLNIVPKFLLKDFYAVLGDADYAIGKLFPDHVAFKAYDLTDETFRGPNYVAVRRARRDLIERLS
jgi:FkbM family methyltransferase